MTLDEFLQYAQQRKPFEEPEMLRLMNEMSDEARRITCRLNAEYHTPDEIRALLSELFGRRVDPSLRVFPPFYTDFGKNIHLGREVFINACCHFQDHGGVTIGDGCQIGHDVVFATLDHLIDPARRKTTCPAPIVLGRNVWVGAHATILKGGDDRRQRHRRRRRRGHEGCAGRHDRRRRPGADHPPNRGPRVTRKGPHPHGYGSAIHRGGDAAAG